MLQALDKISRYLNIFATYSLECGLQCHCKINSISSCFINLNAFVLKDQGSQNWGVGKFSLLFSFFFACFTESLKTQLWAKNTSAELKASMSFFFSGWLIYWMLIKSFFSFLICIWCPGGSFCNFSCVAGGTVQKCLERENAWIKNQSNQGE